MKIKNKFGINCQNTVSKGWEYSGKKWKYLKKKMLKKFLMNEGKFKNNLGGNREQI